MPPSRVAVIARAVVGRGDAETQTLPGEFDGVLVQLGPRMLGPDGVTFYPVLCGLELGERIVTSGSFLVDAETRLNPAAGSIYIGGSSGSVSPPSRTVRPSGSTSTTKTMGLRIDVSLIVQRRLLRSGKVNRR